MSELAVIVPEPDGEDIRYHKSRGLMLESKLSPSLLKVISEAATWCVYGELSARPFRSPELDPSAILEMPKFPDDMESIKAWIEVKRDSYRRATQWINQTRSELLKVACIETLKATDALSKIKLLVYEPLETVDDGAAEAASIGFYDLHDAPPWDTWFLYADRAVLCCVPEFSVTRAQDGIDANPVDCIHWANWSRLVHMES